MREACCSAGFGDARIVPVQVYKAVKGVSGRCLGRKPRQRGAEQGNQQLCHGDGGDTRWAGGGVTGSDTAVADELASLGCQ